MEILCNVGQTWTIYGRILNNIFGIIYIANKKVFSRYERNRESPSGPISWDDKERVLNKFKNS